MNDAAATEDASAWQLLGAVPHRFFFLAGMIQLGLASLWWLAVQAARAIPGWAALPGTVPDTAVHALLMIDGFLPMFMFGFLFTAGPRWLNVDTPQSAKWRPAALIAAASGIALVLAQLVDATLMRAAAALYALAWLWLCSLFLRLLGASRAPDKVHATLVLAALVAGASTVLAFALFGSRTHTWVCDVGVWCFLIPVFATVCHRMIPFFTAGVLPQIAVFRPWWVLAIMVGAAPAHGALAAFGPDNSTWLVDLPAAVFLWLLVWRWGIVQSLANRLLAMLHLGFVWYAIALTLFGVQSLLGLSGYGVLGLAPLHALTMGFCTSLLMAMVTRVTCGHSGRILAADAWTWRLFLLLQLATLSRIAAEIIPGRGWLPAAILLWSLSILPWSAKCAPVYWRPRIDGRAG
ncbi:MAG TPA: NnrS family protein [Casimicrobiaceae bacterium]|nr:NnrS family protein [Casimicrobiaceae bacterium]